MENLDAQGIGLHRGEAQDALVTDGGGLFTGINGQPFTVLLIRYAELLYALSQSDIFLQKQSVDALSLGQRKGQGSAGHLIGGSPIGVILAIGQCFGTIAFATGVAGAAYHTFQQVVGQFLLNNVSSLYHVGRVDGVYMSTFIDGEVENQVAVAAYTAVIEVHQLFGAFYAFVFTLVVEPAWAYRNVAFGRNPSRTVRVSYG